MVFGVVYNETLAGATKSILFFAQWERKAVLIVSKIGPVDAASTSTVKIRLANESRRWASAISGLVFQQYSGEMSNVSLYSDVLSWI